MASGSDFSSVSCNDIVNCWDYVGGCCTNVYGTLVVWYWQQRAQVLREQRAQCHCAAQISHGLLWPRFCELVSSSMNILGYYTLHYDKTLYCHFLSNLFSPETLACIYQTARCHIQNTSIFNYKHITRYRTLCSYIVSYRIDSSTLTYVHNNHSFLKWQDSS
jgi:hypothetical protein